MTNQTEFTDLVLDNGELVRIEYPVKYENEFYDSINNTMKIGEWWSPVRFDGCRAEYLGMLLDRVNMRRVVGML